MISASDPRHGSNRGYNAGCRQPCCKTAHARARKQARNRLILERRTTLTVNGRGVRRRIEALMALGWSTRQLDVLLGRQATYTANLHRRITRDPAMPIYLTTHQHIAALYDRLCMRLPDTTTAERRQIVTRTRNLAARHGYAPPLAWDDIDHDPAPSTDAVRKQEYQHTVDDVVIQRFIDTGRRPRKLTRAENAEALRRLRRRGLATRDIERRYGLKPERYQEVAS